MKLKKQVRDSNDKKVLQEMFGIKPKHRCPVCHRFSLWIPKKYVDGKVVDSTSKECAMCQLIKMTAEENEDGEGQDIKPDNTGE